ncbi:MAG: hypothetical protein ACD_47C00067G0004 [uncultured bacterium]|nr:MAG: hypothetical protein ACD_47C00067G0004 [uncultured bacterium]
MAHFSEKFAFRTCRAFRCFARSLQFHDLLFGLRYVLDSPVYFNGAPVRVLGDEYQVIDISGFAGVGINDLLLQAAAVVRVFCFDRPGYLVFNGFAVVRMAETINVSGRGHFITARFFGGSAEYREKFVVENEAAVRNVVLPVTKLSYVHGGFQL